MKIKFNDTTKFPKSFAITKEKEYEAKKIYTSGSFTILDDKLEECWIDRDRSEWIDVVK